MNHSAINVRYAKALFSLAKENKMLELLKPDVDLIYNICIESNDFILFLESPVVKTSKKKQLIDIIFSEKVDKLTLDFLKLIVENKREVHIPDICLNFLEMVRKDQNIKSAVITTATGIEKASLEKVKTLLEKELNAKIELSAMIKPELIGGLVLRIDDKQYDASVATQLKKIKQRLLESELK
jgi:F-type H+-transporting ATPase subunit delta